MRGLLLGVCGLLLLGGCAAKTHVMTPWISTENATALDVDWVIRYYDPKVVGVSNMTQLFSELKAGGYRTALVIGKELREGDSYDAWLPNLSRAIEETRSVTDMFVLWDDPQRKGGASLRDSLAAALTGRFPDVKFGVSVDVNFTRPPAALEALLPDLDYSYFSVIIGYSYGAIPYSQFPNRTNAEGKYVPGAQGFSDSGETAKVGLAIRKMRAVAQREAEVWFTDNAHFNMNSSTTSNQMLFDYIAGTLAGSDSFGWFMFDISGYRRSTTYPGDMVAPDASYRYYFVTGTLIPLANSRLLESSDRISDLEAVLGQLRAQISELEARLAQLEQISELPQFNRKDGRPAAVILILASGIALFSLTARRN